MATKTKGQSDVQPESAFAGEVNVPGWVTLYTREGMPHMVRECDVEEARLRDGLVPFQYDLDSATSDCIAAHLAAADAVAKAVAEIHQTGGQRDEDVWIISEALGKARDAGNLLQLTLGALVPTEALIASLREYEDVHGKGGLPEHDHIQGLLGKHREAIDRLPNERLQFHRDRAARNKAEQEGNQR